MRFENDTPHELNIEYNHSIWESDIPMQMNFQVKTRQMEMTKEFLGEFGGGELDGNEKSQSKILVGLNGSGKTTLLQFLSEYYSFEKGKNSSDPIVKNFINKWSERGVKTFKSKLKLSFDNSSSDCIRHEYPDDWLENRMRLLRGQYDDDATRDMANIVYGDYINDPNFKEKISQHEESMSVVGVEIVSEFNFQLKTVSSRINAVYHCGDSISPVDDFLDAECNIELLNMAFGPIDFHKEMYNVLETLESINGVKMSRISSEGVFQYPVLKPIYLSALETLELPTLSDELFQALSHSDLIEDILTDKSVEEIWEIFDVKRNKSFLRSYADYIYPNDCGSEEYFYLRGNAFRTSLHYRKEPFKHTDFEIKFNSVLTQFKGDYQTTFSELHDSEMKDFIHPPNSVYQCELPFRRDELIITRWQNRAIYNGFDGIIYSETEDDLYDYLRRDCWREFSPDQKRILFSKIFKVNLEHLKGLFAVQDLSPNKLLNKHLTSGQSRLFSIIQKAANPEVDFLLIDEPEVSLHIDWQRKIIDLVKANSDAKFILTATHSPDIIYHHLSKVIELDSKIEN